MKLTLVRPTLEMIINGSELLDKRNCSIQYFKN